MCAVDSECIFCKIVAGEIPCTKIYEDDRALAFADISPLADGHSLVIPKNHHQNLMAMDPEDLAAVHAASQKVASAMLEGLGAEGVTVMQLNGRAAGQVVFHYHVHLVPRRRGDNLRVAIWEPKSGDPEHIKQVAAKIASAI